MRQETLAETLRELAERRDEKRQAEEAYLNVAARVPEDLRHWHAQAAYLRGYDDAKAEAADTEMLLREAQDEIANAQARVQALAAELAVRMTVPEAQPAAVGVVGAVRWGHLRNGQLLARVFDTLRDATLCEAHEVRVVALVDAAQIVPLASGTAARWRHDQLDRVWHHRDLAACAGYGTVSPLYPGLAQPAQEADA